MKFQWNPQQGPDAEAIERMKGHFIKPSNDPPEAWFMSETQRYYVGLLEALTTTPNLAYVEHYLFAVGAGLKNFDRLDEWVDWFLFLFPYLLEHILERDLLCHTINYFLNLYPQVIAEEYPGFRSDVLQTLGQAIMSYPLWQDKTSVGRHFTASLSASFFFCLKYLEPIELDAWATSIGAIPDPLWQRSVSEWLKGFKRFLDLAQGSEKRYTVTLDYMLEIAGIDWPDSHVVFGRPSSSLPDYLPDSNLTAFWKALNSQFNEES